MNINDFVDKYYEFLVKSRFKSAKDYRTYILDVYKNISGAKSLLNKLSKEKDDLKRIKYCSNLAEIVYHRKEIELDASKKKTISNLHSAVTKLFDFIFSQIDILPADYLVERNISAIWDGRIGLTMKKPYNPPHQGKDVETEHVKYEINVLQKEQVPELCSVLENEYERIIDFAKIVFENWSQVIDMSKIPVVLKKECPAYIYLNNDEYVTKKINELIERGEKISVEDTKSLLRHEERIGGTFKEVIDVHIEIFYRQIDFSCEEHYIAKLACILAHEYAHYLEYAYCEFHGKMPFMDDNVSEAIADFFGVLYSLYRSGRFDIETANHRYNAWKEFEGSGWPYSYALYFLHKPYRSALTDYTDAEIGDCVEKLRRVFSAVLDPCDAYEKLTE
jgi:hypothetical protein